MKKIIKKLGVFLVLMSFISFLLISICIDVEAETNERAKWTKKGNTLHVTIGEVPEDSAQNLMLQKQKIIPFTMRASFDEPVCKSKDGYDIVNIPGLKPWTGTPGAPKLPFKTLQLLIPNGQKAVGVRVRLGPYQEISGEYFIEPAQKPVPISQMDKAEPTPPDPEIYESDNIYPSVPCGDVFLQKKCGYSILIINLFPVQYRPLSGRIFYYQDMDVEVETTLLKEFLEKDTKKQGIILSPKLEAIDEIDSLIDNPEVLDNYRKGLEFESSMQAEPQTYEYVIITTNALKNAFNDLVAAKQAKGVTAKIVTVEDDIYSYYDGTRPDGGSDNQTKIRNFIIDYHTNYGTRYVLLGGDKDRIPIRFLYVQYAVSESIPADMYYGNLDGTFDGDGDGKYGEPTDGPEGGEVDLYAEVFIGRAPVASVDEVSNFVTKTLAYENSTSDYLHTVYMVGERQAPGEWGAPDVFAKRSLELIRWLEFEKDLFYGHYFDTFGLYDQDVGYPPGWGKSELIDIINSGVHILNGIGHGYYQSAMRLGTYDFNWPLFDVINNTDYFFAYSQACFAGGFDEDDCFAEVITTVDDGAFAVVMNSREGCVGTAENFNYEFWDAFFVERLDNLGRMNQDSKEDNIGAIASPDARMTYYELNLFGDPETSIHPGGEFYECSVTSPVNQSYIRGTVDVLGSAYIEEGFESYELYYAPEDNPQDTTLIISSTIPVQDELLGVWDTTQCSDGEYILILKLVTLYGEVTHPAEVIIDNINEPPVFKSLIDKGAAIDRLLEFEVKAEDPDDPETPEGQLIYDAYNLPPGAQFDPQTQIFSWQPSESDKGTYIVTFTVEDNEHTVTQDITLTTVYIEETQITTSISDQSDPAIYQDKIVWEDKRSGLFTDIYMYDLLTSEEIQITTDPQHQSDPAIYQDKIVWEDSRSLNGDIYMYNLLTSEEIQITTDPDRQSYPAIYEDKIVWRDQRDREQIYMYDLSIEQEVQITTSRSYKKFAATYEDKIVWEDYRDGNYDIYMYDLSTEQEIQITTESTNQRYPAIYQDRIIWEDKRDGNYDIYMYDLSTEQEIQITADPRDQRFSAIYQDKIVWEDYRDGEVDIYIYDLSTEQEIQITTESTDQRHPAIYQDKIVWEDYRNGNSDIYMARVFFAPQITSISPTTVSPGETVTITGRNFGDAQGSSTVEFSNGVIVPIQSWSAMEITVIVPQEAETGLLRVVTVGGRSNGAEVIVLLPLQEIDLQAGWNFITLSLDPDLSYTTSSLLAEINTQGGSCVEVARWYIGEWHYYPADGIDFSIDSYRGYFVRCNTFSTLTITGTLLSFDISDLNFSNSGWYTISVPVDGIYTAESLCQAITAYYPGECLEIDRWHHSGWDGHIAGLPFNDFPIEPDKGYFVKYCLPGESADISTLVAPGNHSPILNSIGDQTINEGEEIQFTISATDPDGDSLIYSASNLPHDAEFNNQSFTWQPTYEQAGYYSVIFTVSDGELSDEEAVSIEVKDVLQYKGSISGKVLEISSGRGRGSSYRSRRPVPGAKVILNGSGQHQKLTSNSQGRYKIDNLPKGTYRITASKEGYGTKKCFIRLKENQERKNINFYLRKKAKTRSSRKPYKR